MVQNKHAEFLSSNPLGRVTQWEEHVPPGETTIYLWSQLTIGLVIVSIPGVAAQLGVNKYSFRGWCKLSGHHLAHSLSGDSDRPMMWTEGGPMDHIIHTVLEETTVSGSSSTLSPNISVNHYIFTPPVFCPLSKLKYMVQILSG